MGHINEELILRMISPYIKDSKLTFEDFDKLFSFLTKKEQYSVSEFLSSRGYELVDREEQVEVETIDNVFEDYDDEVDEIDDLDDFEDFESELEVLDNRAAFQDVIPDKDWYENLFVNKNIRQSNEILCTLIQKNNAQAAQDLCIKNRKLVLKYVQMYTKRYGNHLDEEDLEQVGYLGLLKAAQKFDITMDVSFSTYAVWWIKQAISREIMDHGFAIRIPVHMMDSINKVTALYNKLFYDGLQHSEIVSEIMKQYDMSQDKVEDALFLKENIIGYASLDAPVGEDGESHLGDFIPVDNEDTTEKLAIEHDMRSLILNILKNRLSEREQQVIKLRFGFEDGIPRTLEDIGNIMGVTRERIRQIEVKAIRRLKHPTNSKQLRDFWED